MLITAVPLQMITQTIDECKLVFVSKRDGTDREKVNGIWTDTGKKTTWYEYTFLDSMHNKIVLSTKSPEYSQYEGKQVYLQLKHSQYNNLTKTVLYGVIPTTKK